jgi:serine protease Do
VNGAAVQDSRELLKVISTLPVGRIADVFLWRDGKFYVGKVTVEEERAALRPNPEPGPAPKAVPGGVSSEAVGLAMTDLTPEMAKLFKLPNDVKGAVISGIARDSLAEKSGLARGHVVLKVDRTVVTSALTFDQALRQADAEKGALLHVLKPTGDVDFVVLRLK